MTKYIALLRGINVSGQKLIRMELLRSVMNEIGLKDVTTYIQSGNVLFSYPETEVGILADMISDAIRTHFGFEVQIIIATPEMLENAIADNPFANRTPDDSTQPYVGFFSKVPSAESVAALKSSDFGSDEFCILGDRIYIWYGDSAGKSKLSNALIERKLGVISTVRNWKTVKKMLALSS